MRKAGGFLDSAIDRDEVLRAARAHHALRQWAAVVGEDLAERCWPDRYDRGTVWVAVQGSAWAQELRMRKGSLLAKLDALCAEKGLFQDIRFGVRAPVGRFLASDEEPEPSGESREEKRKLSIREIAERRARNWVD